jgi:hypothetical protein
MCKGEYSGTRLRDADSSKRTSFCEEAFDTPGELTSRGLRFIELAKQAIEEEKHNPSIATLQAVWKVMWYEGTRGGVWSQPYYGSLVPEIYRRLRLARLEWTDKSDESSPEVAKLRKALSEILWGMYWQDRYLGLK